MLILVRHGQTAVNAEGRLQGRIDVPLTDVGRRQAEAASSRLPDDVARVVTSPLLRARQTADAFGLDASVPVDVDERWIELDYGEWDGRPLQSLASAGWDAWRADPAYAPPGGESLVAVAARVRSACDDLAEEARESTIVVVSHVSPIKAAVAWALDVGPSTSWRMFLDVAAICRIAVGATGPSLTSYNSVAHLTARAPHQP
ncbi:MAG TPA: histidine phosphatase family protein [Acidimicrobiales bacterium]|nr:histidine phosphatase family protein [Acidimicrobiales bacterium]